MIGFRFDKLENVEAVGGESASLRSRKRENEKRAISPITRTA